jgi:hypothetical protein
MTAIAIAVIAVSPMLVIDDTRKDEDILIMVEQKRGSKVKEGYGLRIL